MTQCLIVDVTDAYEQAPGRPAGCELIPYHSRPTVLQPDRETAEREALRLAKAHPLRNFAIFEAVAMSTTAAVPTHVSMSGVVLVRGSMPVLVAVSDADGSPF